MPEKKSRDAALVLSGGGARGLAHIGVIEELLDRGYRITSIAGCSIGSVVGGLHAVGKLEEYKNWILDLDKIDILRMIDFTLSNKGFIKGEKIFDRMRRLRMIPDVAIEDLPIPFSAVAVDIISGREHVFREGGLHTAIRASIGIPSVFTPVRFGSSLLVDGGVLTPLPLDHAKRKKGDILVAVDLMSLVPYRRPAVPAARQKERPASKRLAALVRKWEKFFEIPEKKDDREIGYFDLATRAVQLMQHGLTEYALEKNPPDILIRISRESAAVFEFYRAKELIAYGRERCAEALDRWEGRR